jgi:ElaB/YqjD/DUF883 family membrane-anchored ribosome-binding protein
MIDPSDEESNKEDSRPATQTKSRKKRAPAEGPLMRAAHKVSAAAGDGWRETKARAATARDRTDLLLRENPVPAILGALTLGVAIGLAIRYASSAEEKKIEVKPLLGNAQWGFLSLPFLWPFFRSLKEKYEDSAEAVKERATHYAKPVRKRWKEWMR